MYTTLTHIESVSIEAHSDIIPGHTGMFIKNGELFYPGHIQGLYSPDNSCSK